MRDELQKKETTNSAKKAGTSLSLSLCLYCSVVRLAPLSLCRFCIGLSLSVDCPRVSLVIIIISMNKSQASAKN